ncbi:MAG: HD domain-containing protein [Armatimonadota bacterium]|nr:HD domain-containing protein [bacterium]
MVGSVWNFDILMDAKSLSGALLNARDSVANQADSLGGIEMMRAYSDLTDALIRRIFQIAAKQAENDDPCATRKALREIAIAAVGGYGRQEMSPFSDVDVTFIAGTGDDDEIDLVVKRAFRILMDVLEQAHLKVGYSYRRVDEVENLPLETETALLDARWISGNPALFNAFESALRQAITPAAFVIGHINGRNSLGASLNTPYLVEPNIKECRGGLRDLHAARWIAQIAFDLAGSDIWNGLRSRGIVSDADIENVTAAAEFLARTRNTLHLLSGRGLDMLSAGRHMEVAARMGYPDSTPDTFLSMFYQHMHKIRQVYNKVAEACLEQKLEIEPGVFAQSGMLRIFDRGLPARDPSAMFRVFQHSRSYNLRIHRETCDLIASTQNVSPTHAGFLRSFMDIISEPGAGAVLRSMAELGVLRIVLPAFKGLMSLVPGDAAHKFTIGEHSLRTVEQLDSLFAGDDEQFSDVFSRIQKLEVLYLAALLHDVGKMGSKKDHARTGASIAGKAAAALGMSDESRSRVEFLVKHHLRMGETARLRDLHQKRTIRDFVSVVKDAQLLDMLFLLTVADNRSVGTQNWSRVQIRFLTELHERAMAALRSPESSAPDLDRHRRRVRRELCLANLPPDEVDEHCASMPASYLLNTPPDELAAHIGYVRNARKGMPAIEIKDDRMGQFTLLTVVAMDRKGLLSEIAGALNAMSIDIHAAQIFTRHSIDDIAIDILFIDFEGRQLAEMKKWHLEGELTSVLSGQTGIDQLLQRCGKKKFEKTEELHLRVLDNLSDHETVIEVRAIDTHGILHYLTRKISEMGFNIHSARVATWGHEARDVFYITDRHGCKLSEADLEQLQNWIGKDS